MTLEIENEKHSTLSTTKIYVIIYLPTTVYIENNQLFQNNSGIDGTGRVRSLRLLQFLSGPTTRQIQTLLRV